MGDVIELGPAKLKATLAKMLAESDWPEAKRTRVLDSIMPRLELLELAHVDPMFTVPLPAGLSPGDRAALEEALSRLMNDCQLRIHVPLLALAFGLQDYALRLSDELEESRSAGGRVVAVAQEQLRATQPSPPEVGPKPAPTELNVLELLRLDLEKARAAGNDSLSAEDVLKHIAMLQGVATERTPTFLEALLLERWRGEREVFVAKAKQAADSAIEDFRLVNANGELAVKAAMTINGGGAIAVLAFVGHLISNHPTAGLVSRFSWPLSLFVGGVLASATAYGFRYLTQYAYSRRWKAWGHAGNIAAILTTLGSLAAFGWAARVLYVIFGSL